LKSLLGKSSPENQEKRDLRKLTHRIRKINFHVFNESRGMREKGGVAERFNGVHMPKEQFKRG